MKELLEKLDMYGIKIPGITPRYFNGPDGRHSVQEQGIPFSMMTLEEINAEITAFRNEV